MPNGLNFEREVALVGFDFREPLAVTQLGHDHSFARRSARHLTIIGGLPVHCKMWMGRRAADRRTTPPAGVLRAFRLEAGAAGEPLREGTRTALAVVNAPYARVLRSKNCALSISW